MNDSVSTPDIHHLQGQIHGLRSLIHVLARAMTDQDQFREDALNRLESTRIALLGSAVPEMTISGIDAVETWLLKIAPPRA